MTRIIHDGSKRTDARLAAISSISGIFNGTKGHTDLFVSAKTVAPIPARHTARPEALIQTSLDPQVRSIECGASVTYASAQVGLDVVVVQRDDGRFLLDIVPARRVSDASRETLLRSASGPLS